MSHALTFNQMSFDYSVCLYFTIHHVSQFSINSWHPRMQDFHFKATKGDIQYIFKNWCGVDGSHSQWLLTTWGAGRAVPGHNLQVSGGCWSPKTAAWQGSTQRTPGSSCLLTRINVYGYFDNCYGYSGVSWLNTSLECQDFELFWTWQGRKGEKQVHPVWRSVELLALWGSFWCFGEL